MIGRIATAWRRGSTRDIPLGVVLALFALLYAPFLTKAFHVDDPLFLWTARHLTSDPLDFYGFGVNWYGTTSSISEVVKNPPLASYYIWLCASLVGWSELALHLAFLLPALGVVAGTWSLARVLGARPGEAALAAALTPAFLVSSTTVMCDVLMLCAYVWAVVLWIDGLERASQLRLGAAAVLVAVSALTKYFGMSLLPLLLLYGLLRQRRLGTWALWLVLPLAALGGYQWLTHAMYGRGLLLDAAAYATRVGGAAPTTTVERALIGLIFTGGCFLPALFYAPRLWSRWAALGGLVLLAAAAVALLVVGRIGRMPLTDDEGIRFGLVAQAALFLVTGLAVVALGVLDARDRRDAGSALLLLWILGTLFFAAFVNWSVNARSLLPMMPAFGVLLARRVERREQRAGPWPAWARAAPLVLSALAALAVSHADAQLAGSAREAARDLAAQLGGRGAPVWFQGHWGFQYYAEGAGMQAIDAKASRFAPGEAIVIPRNNTNLFKLPARSVAVQGVAEWSPSPYLATMNGLVGAGFYSDGWGALPFALGSVPKEQYVVLSVTAPFGP